MKAKNAIPKAVLDQFKRWGRAGGLSRMRQLNKIQRSALAKSAGIASGKARRNGNGA